MMVFDFFGGKFRKPFCHFSDFCRRGISGGRTTLYHLFLSITIVSTRIKKTPGLIEQISYILNVKFKLFRELCNIIADSTPADFLNQGGPKAKV